MPTTAQAEPQECPPKGEVTAFKPSTTPKSHLAVCEVCNKAFVTAQQAKYCDVGCRMKAHRNRTSKIVASLNDQRVMIGREEIESVFGRGAWVKFLTKMATNGGA